MAAANYGRARISPAQSGFTLIEVMVVTAVIGFLIVAVTGTMVSFTNFKYMADTQEQLKTEATFAANQIDLLIRNGTGIPDLCMASLDPASASDEVQFCNGRPRYEIDDSVTTIIGQEGFLNDENIHGVGYTKNKCTSPQVITGHDVLNTAQDSAKLDDLPVTADPPPNTLEAAADTVACDAFADGVVCVESNGPYRLNCPDPSYTGFNPFNTPGNINNENIYLVTQTKRNNPIIDLNRTLSIANSYSQYRFGEAGSQVYTPSTTTSYYNQIIYPTLVDVAINGNVAINDEVYNYQFAADGTVSRQDNRQKRIAIFEYQVNTDTTSCTNDVDRAAHTPTPVQTLCTHIPEFVIEEQNSPGNFTAPMQCAQNQRQLFLTSNAVDVTKLEFDCKLANYGLPNQSALITYTIELRKVNRSLSSELYAANLTAENYADLPANTFTNYKLTRTVSVRNSAQPFIFNQTGQ